MAGIFEILCACVVILYLIYRYVTADFNYWTSRGINGPKPVPFFGNVAKFMMGKKCLGDVYKEIYDQYPTESVVGIFRRTRPVLLLRDAKYIKQVLIKDFATFTDRNAFVYDKAEPMSMHLFRLDAVRWRPLRTRLSPTFTSGKLKDMFHLLLNCADYFEKYLDEKVPENGVVECKDLTSKFTVDVIGSCAFGLEMNALKEENNEFQKMGRYIFRSSPTVILKNTLKEIPWFYKNFGHLIDDHEITKFMTDITRSTIEYRKQNNIHRHDFIDTLIDIKDNPDKLGFDNVTDEFIAAQAFVFFAAGFETSSTTMSHAMYELALNQSIQDKVREEIKEVLNNSNGEILYDDIKKMTYLEKVFQETLRKYPPVMYLVRKPIKNYTFEGTKINLRKGQDVIIPIYAIQNDPNIYPDPEVFDPERFSPENMEQRNSMYYLPFGDGPRNCIGARFAVNQTKVGLIKVLMNYKLDVCEKTQIPVVLAPLSGLMFQTTHGIYVKLSKIT
ncbi:probable cytochrome P450 6a14 [Solenopsis invicta]|uniref:CYP6A14 n=1 Tax=Solenopsis invicta TaxID=13686 RepID=A0A0G2QX44_SOLIN|nr:probable cytochrome P450 6a14 [Solenopsis invicta]AIC33177.1 CYP6A14 [Solenopsis invicta]QRY28579.1 cytochrome P450 CYP6AS161 [Solenopsis invicta]